MEMFRTYDSSVSLTSDKWTSTFREPFVSMEEAHNSFNIKTHKIFSISLDNATTNTKAMDFLKEDTSIKLLLGGSLMHVRCCAHILNLCVQDGLDTPTRWNLTYKLLHDAIAYRDILTDTYDESRTNGLFITNDHWSLAKIIHDPNIHMVILECTKIVHSIRETSQANCDPSTKDVLDSMKDKWHAYFTEFPPIYGIGVILDPGVKLEGMIYDVPNYVNKCKLILERLCQYYEPVIQQEPIGSSKGKSGFGFLGQVVRKHRPDSSSSSSNVEYDFHIIQWLKNYSLKFHVLAKIAKDILAIPASTIASESAFSA
ncbi:putative AC transposase, partial [Bienertia sinuspersici]